MWLLLTVENLISALGTTRDFFGGSNPASPKMNRNVSQMISYWGYPSEEYDGMTEDSYILEIYRISYGKKNSENRDAGYDVWMGNSRGNTWSRKHLKFSPTSPEFWAFSLDEMAKYDLPATINFIVEKTGQERLYYVGHSQGTTIAFIAFSTNPELAKRIKIFFALAPVTTVQYTRSPMRRLTTLSRQAVKVLFGDKMFSPHTFFEQFIATKVCNRKLFRRICSNFLFSFSGFDPKNLNMSRLDVYLAQSQAGTSVQNMLHWSQAVNSGLFQAFDWGNPDKNMEHFHQLTPPVYNVSQMEVPTAMWSGGQDNVADSKDTENLLPKITRLIYYKFIPHYNHVDFYLGQDAPQEIYQDLIRMMEECF
ncbi:lipase member K-like isoform X3 [Phyllostomus hastatus]|uniref:lipase member K-like isoform X3 n=1 Tax=Phyllostomus hastatus TaxID=9423 RepID=UPI001E684E42|nr:lipase member K-like isoform X3 [Phyllostomus hastatus]